VLEGERVEYEREIQFEGVGKRFLRAVYVPEWNDVKQVQGWIASILDVTERKRAEETERMLMREVEHRSNNLLAVVQAIAHRSLAGAKSFDDAKDAFEARLQALARAHRQITKSKMSGMTMRDVVRLELDPFATRTAIEGSDVMLGHDLVQSFALVLHELATNAVKYGALSHANGKIEVAWSVAESGAKKLLNFEWQERGGPPVTSPNRNGFGTSLLKATFPESQLNYALEGLICKISVPLR
jgi:two-component sensor histidine kinase